MSKKRDAAAMAKSDRFRAWDYWTGPYGSTSAPATRLDNALPPRNPVCERELHPVFSLFNQLNHLSFSGTLSIKASGSKRVLGTVPFCRVGEEPYYTRRDTTADPLYVHVTPILCSEPSSLGISKDIIAPQDNSSLTTCYHLFTSCIHL